MIVTAARSRAACASWACRRGPAQIADLQAASAVGQGKLFRVYDELLRERGRTAAQVLLTFHDMRERTNYLNARQTLRRLLEWDVVPVINENDTTATDEISFGDNDFLAAQVAVLLGAERLVLLTNTDGLYTANPATRPGRAARRRDPRPRRARGAGDRPRDLARWAPAGCARRSSPPRWRPPPGSRRRSATACAPARSARALAGEDEGTRFRPQAERTSSFKLWLKYAKPAHGRLVVDAGAARALREGGTSLLPVGVTEVRGDFDAGDAVEVVTDGARHRQGHRGVLGRRAAPRAAASAAPRCASCSAPRPRRPCTATTSSLPEPRRAAFAELVGDLVADVRARRTPATLELEALGFAMAFEPPPSDPTAEARRSRTRWRATATRTPTRRCARWRSSAGALRAPPRRPGALRRRAGAASARSRRGCLALERTTIVATSRGSSGRRPAQSFLLVTAADERGAALLGGGLSALHAVRLGRTSGSPSSCRRWARATGARRAGRAGRAPAARRADEPPCSSRSSMALAMGARRRRARAGRRRPTRRGLGGRRRDRERRRPRESSARARPRYARRRRPGDADALAAWLEAFQGRSPREQLKLARPAGVASGDEHARTARRGDLAAPPQAARRSRMRNR